MKRIILTAVLVAALIAGVISCASTSGETAQQSRRASLLPLNSGWYQYDFERTIKGIEDEYNFELSTGMKMVQELTWRYAGVVCGVEVLAGNSVLFDPVSNFELLVSRDGKITCAENLSIKGKLNYDGSFYWSGLYEEHGRQNSIFVRGSLTPLPTSARGGPEFDGIYHMTDKGTGRQQLVKIKDGFYTWNYIDGEEAGFTPWPTLIQPDGSFSFSMDMTTVMEMGEFSRMNFSTGYSSEGRITPGEGISMEEVTRTAGQGLDQVNAPQVFSGMLIASSAFPNEAIPDNIEDLVRAGRSAVRAEAKPSRANYPSWYLDLPVKEGYFVATGEKTFDNKETALAMAEAAASASLADQIMVRIAVTTTEVSTNSGTMIDDRIRAEAYQRLNYQIVQSVYDENSRTAFVLLETKE
ncbi:MAG: hypothetical protein LBU66_01810 [Treponema sp.]|jgi:hypothetical protein|nr:hypothetical protein [Treponema sp.]